MKLYVNRIEVADIPVVTRQGSQSLAMEDIEFAVKVDSSEDRTEGEAYIDASQLFRFDNQGGSWFAGWNPETKSWCVWADGASVIYKDNMDRDEAIKVAFGMSYVHTGGESSVN